LRYEQTFNVINFEDKLKGLEDHPEYPKEKAWKFKAKLDTNVGYNIISNLPFQQHFYTAPDQRPVEKKIVEKQREITTTGLRDYNIITNRYLELHEDKTKTDKMIEKCELAEKYWKTHNYDPVSGQFYDPIKEEEFLVYCSLFNCDRKRDTEAKVHGKNEVYKLPISVQKEGLLYNPINMKIEDRERLEERELRERRKKKRYELRYGLEHDMRTRGIEEYERTIQQRIQRMNYKRYVDYIDRGFDILTNKRLDSEEMQKRIYKPQVVDKPKIWDIIEYQKALGKTSEVSMVNQKENMDSKLEPLSRKDNEAQSSIPKQAQILNSGCKQTKISNRMRSTGGSKPLNQTVISQAGAKNVANIRSNRSIRTGAFQRSFIK